MSEEKLQLDEKLWQLKAGPLAAEDVALILLNPAEFPAQLIEELSLKTALLYWYGKIEFIDGDWIMNNLFGFWSNGLPGNPDFPKAAWDCFSAFDEGEFYHREDDSKNAVVGLSANSQKFVFRNRFFREGLLQQKECQPFKGWHS